MASTLVVRREDVCFGSPCVKDSRLKVTTVVFSVRKGLDEERLLLDNYEFLTSDIIDACVYFANKERGTYIQGYIADS